jgi:hypothetical protein
MIGGNIGTGQLISLSGRYKWLLTVSALVLMFGAFLMTHLTATTADWTMWIWMLLLGLGIGPSMAGLTIVIQSSVSVSRLGVASSSLTLLRQIGATIGLAIAGTVFASDFQNRLPSALALQGVPQQLITQLVKNSDSLQGVGNAAALLNHLLPAQQQQFIPHIVAGINNAFSLATGDIFWITLVAGALAFVCTLAIPDRELQHSRIGVAAVPSAQLVSAQE